LYTQINQPIKRQVDQDEYKTNHQSKNKTHQKLILKMVLGINTHVTRITVLETSEGTANGVVRLWERAKAERFAVAMTPLVEAERLARKTERFSERPDKNG
jgi:tRNA U34 5-methylaminomethyl-2-thiouridine-forming methyltransferase MnmC